MFIYHNEQKQSINNNINKNLYINSRQSSDSFSNFEYNQ